MTFFTYRWLLFGALLAFAGGIMFGVAKATDNGWAVFALGMISCSGIVWFAYGLFRAARIIGKMSSL
jgi:1,4-dihydroxy-2-naphthoate octaprenyltransferase